MDESEKIYSFFFWKSSVLLFSSSHLWRKGRGIDDNQVNGDYLILIGENFWTPRLETFDPRLRRAVKKE